VFGLPEIISDGVNGLLMEPRDVGALVTGLRRFLELDPAERVALGRAGGERVRAAFARSEWARPWSSLLRHLADGPGSASRSAP
jgi:glycosyltransferase involved in cell wall biosynthesis